MDTYLTAYGLLLYIAPLLLAFGGLAALADALASRWPSQNRRVR
jgi:hypothetical protein